jgi:GxxExxY protein
MHADGRGFEDPITEVVLGAAFEVANVLGAGFLEKVYERAMLRELRLRGSVVRPQAAIPVSYKGEAVGEYFADLMVEERVIVASASRRSVRSMQRSALTTSRLRA